MTRSPASRPTDSSVNVSAPLRPTPPPRIPRVQSCLGWSESTRRFASAAWVSFADVVADASQACEAAARARARKRHHLPIHLVRRDSHRDDVWSGRDRKRRHSRATRHCKCQRLLLGGARRNRCARGGAPGCAIVGARRAPSDRNSDLCRSLSGEGALCAFDVPLRGRVHPLPERARRHFQRTPLQCQCPPARDERISRPSIGDFGLLLADGSGDFPGGLACDRLRALGARSRDVLVRREHRSIESCRGLCGGALRRQPQLPVLQCSVRL